MLSRWKVNSNQGPVNLFPDRVLRRGDLHLLLQRGEIFGEQQLPGRVQHHHQRHLRRRRQLQVRLQDETEVLRINISN